MQKGMCKKKKKKKKIKIFLFFLFYLFFFKKKKKKKIKTELHIFSWFPGLQNLWKFTAEQLLKSFSGRNSLILQQSSIWSGESTELRDWIRWVWGNRHSKMQKCFCWQIFCVFLSHHYRFTNCFEILRFIFSNLLPRRVSTYKILTF